jgi:hypothetical protein
MFYFESEYAYTPQGNEPNYRASAAHHGPLLALLQLRKIVGSFSWRPKNIEK